MNVLSDAVIAGLCLAMVAGFIRFNLRRKDWPFRGAIYFLVLFLALCAATRIMEIVVQWVPLYSLDGVVQVATAIAAIVAGIALYPIIPFALRMRSPAELAEVNKRLRKEIEEHEAEVLRRREAEEHLEATVQQLQLSNEEMEQFAHAVSHDLQTPLRGVLMYSQLLARESGDGLSADGKEYLGYIESSGRRMRQLINDLLELLRVGRQKTLPTTVAVTDSVEQACKQLRASIDEQKAIIDVGQMPAVFAHGGQVVQLFQNMIGNAIKYVAPGVQPRIAISAQRNGDFWHFTVQDNGIGIPEKHLESVFIIFRRLHDDEAYAGTGVGLALCKKIVEQHGGRIWVESEVGVGTQFHFTLPASDAEVPSARL
jgi:signal transduction histidine kinase